MITIETLSDRPDLIDLTTRWAWNEWGLKSGRSLASDLERAQALVDAAGFEKTFILLEDDIPAAMASLVRADLDERPDLTPWLAGVYVNPPYRGRGHAVRVVSQVEQAAIAEAVGALWLYTSTAPGLYRKLGWNDHEQIDRPSGRSIIMHKSLTAAGKSTF